MPALFLRELTAIAMCVSVVGNAQGQDAGIRFGIGGYAKIGSPAALWSPGNDKAEWIAKAQDPTGAWLRTAGHGLVLLQPGRPQARISYQRSGESAWKHLTPRNTGPVRELLRQSDVLVAVIGETRGFKDIEFDDDRQFRYVTITAQDIPADSRALRCLDVLIIAADYSLPPAANRAVKNWVREGGFLLVVTGREAEELRGSSLSVWCPVRVDDSVFASEFIQLERFSGHSAGLRYEDDTPQIPAARLKVGDSVRGYRILAESRGPVLVEAAYGFGRVVVLGADLHAPPFYDDRIADPAKKQWRGLVPLCRRLILPDEEQRSKESKQAGVDRRLAQSGISDLASQFVSAQDQFDDVAPSSHWIVIVLIAGYIVVIGPLDYFLVHRVLKRPRLTWITFPLFVVAASVFASWKTSAVRDAAVVNQLDLIDVDLASATVRERSFANFFSARSDRFSLEAESTSAWRGGGKSDSASVTSRRFWWVGLPEEGFGGMYRESGFQMTTSQYDLREQRSLSDVPFRARSARPFVSENTSDLSDATLFRSDFKSSATGEIEGTFQHNLPVPIENWVLVHGGRVYFPRVALKDMTKAKLAPGTEFDPTDYETYRRDLKSYLTGVRRRRASYRERGEEERRLIVERADYDPDSLAMDDIVRMMTFHESAGGSEYTGLRHGPLGDLDLTPLLRLNRAVLFARIRAPSAKILVNGKEVKTRRETFLRVVFPVTPHTADVP